MTREQPHPIKHLQLDDRVRILEPLVNNENSSIPEEDLPVGLEGTVTLINRVDDRHWQIGVAWDNGRGLMLLVPHDNGRWEVVK